MWADFLSHFQDLGEDRGGASLFEADVDQEEEGYEN